MLRQVLFRVTVTISLGYHSANGWKSQDCESLILVGESVKRVSAHFEAMVGGNSAFARGRKEGVRLRVFCSGREVGSDG